MYPSVEMLSILRDMPHSAAEFRNHGAFEKQFVNK
jgi:hypothetical protein